MTDIAFLSAVDLAALLRAGHLSSQEVLEATLDRIARVDPTLGAVVETWPDAARHTGPGGPLDGVPMTVKESFRVTCARHTWGVPAFAGCRADRDAEVVRRLRRAGARVIGTTNVAAMLADVAATRNEIYGRTANPWDLDRSPGGSSGGAAAALAAGLTYLEYGSDLAGSIRVPAAWCGVYGLRPTAGTVPTRGFSPPGRRRRAPRPRCVVGGRTARPDRRGPARRAARHRRPRRGGGARLRVATGPTSPTSTSSSARSPPPPRSHTARARPSSSPSGSRTPPCWGCRR